MRFLVSILDFLKNFFNNIRKPVVLPFEPIDVIDDESEIKLKATMYYLALEADYSKNDRNGAFRDPSGNVLYYGSKAFKKAASIEGSCKLLDGRVLNYHSFKQGEVRWKVVDAPFGLGARNNHLVPFKSCAVDRNVIPLGTKLFVAETKGLLIEGKEHDGIWIADDVGGAIKGNRIDLFCGAGKKSMALLKGIKYMQPLSVKEFKEGSSTVATSPQEDHAGLLAQEKIFDIAYTEFERGVKEVYGEKHNPRILEYHGSVGIKNASDELAWCSSFVNWCVEKAGHKGTNSAMARSWINWGKEVGVPKRGDVCIIWRSSPESWKGHVFFFDGYDGDYVKALGGNQLNKVSTTKYPKSRVLGFRRIY